MASPLILLFGMPRSGTTWVGKIFDSHSETFYCHEPDSGRGLADVPALARVADAETYRATMERFVDSLGASHDPKVRGKLPLFPKRYLSPLKFRLFELSVLLSKFAGRYVRGFPVLNFWRPSPSNEVVLVWKSIESCGRMGVIARVTRNRKAVLILRHPCGYVASVLRGESGGKFVADAPFSEDYELLKMVLDTEQARSRGLTIERMAALHPVERLAWFWVLFNEKAMDEIEQVDGCTWVRYEDLCRDPRAVSRRLFEFCGLPWDDQTERFLTQSTTRQHDAYFSVYKDPLRAANKWQEQLALEDIERINAVVKDSKPGRLYGAERDGA